MGRAGRCKALLPFSYTPRRAASPWLAPATVASRELRTAAAELPRDALEGFSHLCSNV
jgi:hypothetical protein